MEEEAPKSNVLAIVITVIVIVVLVTVFALVNSSSKKSTSTEADQEPTITTNGSQLESVIPDDQVDQTQSPSPIASPTTTISPS